MPRPAVAVASAGQPAARARTTPDTELSQQLDTLGKQIGYGRRLRPGRSQLLVVGLFTVGLWLVVVFGQALGQLNDATQRQLAAAAEAQTLQAQLEAGRRELTLVQTDAFQRMQARALGMGRAGEIAFALTSAAPAAAPIVPLGESAGRSSSQTPLAAWLELLFGS